MLTLRCPKENRAETPNSAFYSQGWPYIDPSSTRFRTQNETVRKRDKQNLEFRSAYFMSI